MGQEKDFLPNVLIFSRFGARYVFAALLFSYFFTFGTAVGSPLPGKAVALFFAIYAGYIFLLSRFSTGWDVVRIPRWTLIGELLMITLSVPHDPLDNLPLLLLLPLIQIEYGLRNTRESYIEAAYVTSAGLVLGLCLRVWWVGPIAHEVWVMMLPAAFLSYYTWKVMQQRQFISDRAQEDRSALKLAASAAGLAAWTVDIKNKRLIWDEAAQKQAGKKPGEFKGSYHEFFSQMSKSDADRVEKAFAEALQSKGAVDIEYDLLWSDKSLHRIACRGRAVVNAQGEVDTIIGVSMDITRSNKDRAEAAQAVERLALTQKITGAGIWFYDVVNRRLTWDENVRRIFGYPDGVLGGTLDQFAQTVHADDRERVGQAIERALTQQQPYAIEYRIQTPDGGTRIVSAIATVRYHEQSKQALSALGVLWDVTTQRRDQERLHAMSQRALTIGEALRVGAWRYWPSSRKLEIDKAFRQLVGIGTHDVVETLDPILQRLVAEDREGFLRTIQETLSAGGEFSWFWRLLDDKGVLRDFQWLGRVLPGLDGTEDELVACVMDVTRLVQTRKTLETQVQHEREVQSTSPA